MTTQELIRLVRNPVLLTLALLLPAAAPAADGGTTGAGSLTLSEAVSLALEGNPRLQTFDLELRRMDAEAMQAGLKPNPELGLEIENFAGSGDVSGFGAAEYTLTIGQLFERGGKRQRRAEAARLAGEMVAWEYESARLEVINQVADLFIQVVAAQRQLELTDRLIEVAAQDLAAVRHKVEAGSASPVELSRARVALATVRLDRESVLAELEASRARLAATWGAEQATFTRAEGNLDAIQPPPDSGLLIRRLEANPDLARWETEKSRRAAELALAKAVGAVDLNASGGIRRINETGDQALVVGISIPLAVHDRNQGGIAAARYGLRQVDLDRKAQALELQARLQAGLAELAAAYKEVSSLRDRILPAAQEATAAADEAYRRGLFSFTDVLAVRSTSYELQGRLISAQARYHTAVAELERLVAGPLNGNAPEQEQH